MNFRKIFLFIGISSWFIFLPGCEGGAGGTTGGNPGSVLFKSAAFSNTASGFSTLAIGDFRFCVTQLKLVTTSEGISASQEAQLGLIDVSTETQATEWGTVTIPLEQDLQEIHIEVHSDPAVCGGQTFSLSYKNTQITKDLEFKFVFDPVIALSEGDVISLGLTNIAVAIEQASLAGKLNNEQIAEFLTTETKGTANKE